MFYSHIKTKMFESHFMSKPCLSVFFKERVGNPDALPTTRTGKL